MGVWKYVDDYRLEEYVDEKGKIRNKVTYIGGDFVLTPAISAENRRMILLLTILLWLPFVAAIIPPSRAAYLFYVMLPFVFSIIPMYMMTTAAISLFRTGEILTREKSDKISRNLPHCSLIIAILTVAAFLGITITAIIDASDMFFGDIVFGALSLIMAAASSFIYSKCRLIKAKRAHPQKRQDT